MKQTIIKLFLFILVAGSLAGCLKKNDMNIDPDKTTSNFLQMEWLQPGGTTINSGLQFFGVGSLTYPASDVSDTVNVFTALSGASTPLSKDLNVTVGPDFKANNDNFKTDSIQYENMPDSLYHIVATNLTIKAGTNGTPASVIFFPSKINPAKNYALPLTITNPAGYTVSGNYGHIYFHTIGNPMAGGWTWNYTRWNGTDSVTGTKSGASFTGHSTQLLPDNGTTVEVQSGYGAQNGFNVRYVISFTNSNGKLSNFKVVMNPDDVKNNLNANGITLTDPARIITADPVNNIFEFSYQVFNGSSFRFLKDKFYH